MILNGLILGLITFAGWATVFHKLPPQAKEWCARHSLITDAFFTFVTYLVLSDALVSLLACAWVGILFETYMFTLRNRNDLDWLFDSVDSIRDSFESFKQGMRDKNEDYKRNREQTIRQAA